MKSNVFKLVSIAMFTLLVITFGHSKVSAADPVVISDIKANLFIGDPGEMVDSFEITVVDISKVADVIPEDFEITGNYDGLPLNEDGELVQENYEGDGIALTIEGNTIIMEVKDFKYPGGFISDFEVTNSKYPELSFTKEDVITVSTRTVDDFEKETFTGSNGVTIPYRLNNANTGNPEPLVIWMHGAGEVGTDNVKPITASRGAVAFAESDHTTNVIAAQYSYKYSVELTDTELADMKAFFKAYKELIDQLVAEGEVDPDRIYLTGASMGGGLTLQFMLAEPDLFAAVVGIASRGTIKDLDELESVADLPIWLFHAEEDTTNVSEISKNIYNKLQSLGNSDAKLTIYSTEFMSSLKLYGGLLHWSWVPALNDNEMIDWLFSQVQTEVVEEPKEETPASEKFPDVPADHEAVDAISKLVEAGVIEGYVDGSFKPDNSGTRAEVSKIISTLLNLQSDAQNTGFTDVKSGVWYTPHINVLHAAGHINGYEDGTFKPEENISRAEFAKIVVEAYGLEIVNSDIPFDDVNEDTWYAPYIETLYANGLIKGQTTTIFGPSNDLKRIDLALLLSNVEEQRRSF